MLITLTRELARAASMDAGNANMRKHGWSTWNQDDADVATDKLVALMQVVEPENPTWWEVLPC